jgi:hypothetical protein
MWEPRRLTTPWAFMAYYRDNVTFYVLQNKWSFLSKEVKGDVSSESCPNAMLVFSTNKKQFLTKQIRLNHVHTNPNIRSSTNGSSHRSNDGIIVDGQWRTQRWVSLQWQETFDEYLSFIMDVMCGGSCLVTVYSSLGILQYAEKFKWKWRLFQRPECINLYTECRFADEDVWMRYGMLGGFTPWHCVRKYLGGVICYRILVGKAEGKRPRGRPRRK